MAADPDLVRVVTAYGAQMAAVRARVLAYVQAVWGSLGGYDEADIERFAAAVIPVIAGGQLQTAALTDASLAAIESQVFGIPVRPLGVAAGLVTTEAMRGVPAEVVYRRPGVNVWAALKDGARYEDAVAGGLRRAESLAATDIQLAKTHAAQSVLERKPNVVGHRRVLRGASSCGLCVVASTQRYSRAELQPCHPGCDCGVLPIYGDHDPGQVIDPDRLEAAHAAIAERFGAFNSGARSIPGVKHPDGKPVQYRDVLVTHTHGEIGPVLGIRGQKFAGPDDLKDG